MKRKILHKLFHHSKLAQSNNGAINKIIIVPAQYRNFSCWHRLVLATLAESCLNSTARWLTTGTYLTRRILHRGSIWHQV